MLTPGMPEMLNGAVYGTDPIPPTGRPAISNGGGPSATNAVVAVVGVRSKSTSSNTAATAASNSSRRRSARSTASIFMFCKFSYPARTTGVRSSSECANTRSP